MRNGVAFFFCYGQIKALNMTAATVSIAQIATACRQRGLLRSLTLMVRCFGSSI